VSNAEVNCSYRYPPGGNLTVRTPQDKSYSAFGVEVPAGTPISLHMYTLHNSSKQWFNSKKFAPDRWTKGSNLKEGDSHYKTYLTAPKCPFLISKQAQGAAAYDVYDGLGFEEGSLSYFPFSVGERACLGKDLVLTFLRSFVYEVCRIYRLNPVEPPLEEDCGLSAFAAIIPFHSSSMQLKVTTIPSLEDLVAGRIQVEGDEVQKGNEGWADEE
jgi:cytochrome P450